MVYSLDNNNLSLIVSQGERNLPQEAWHYIEMRIQQVVDSSFKTQFLDYDSFRNYGMGDVVVLVGSSTAGKTSIIKALMQIEPNRLEDGGDLRGLKLDAALLQKYNPNEFDILKGLMNDPLSVGIALWSEQRSWKADLSKEDIAKGEEAIERIKKSRASCPDEERRDAKNQSINVESEMFNDAFERSSLGQNVILDILDIDTLAKNILVRNFNGPLRTALVFCPFHVLSSRMEKRNKESAENKEFSNQRIGDFPLIQFSQIYGQRKNGQTTTFERLTRDQVIQTFNINFDRKIAANAQKGSKSLSETKLLADKESSLACILDNLGFKDGIDSVEIAPKNQHLYTHFINSSVLAPECSAKFIHAGTHQR